MALVIGQFRCGTSADDRYSTVLVLLAHIAFGFPLRVIKLDSEMLVPAALIIQKLRRRSGVTDRYSLLFVLLAKIVLRLTLRSLLDQHSGYLVSTALIYDQFGRRTSTPRHDARVLVFLADVALGVAARA